MARARQLDLTLSDAAQDLGFTLDLSERARRTIAELSDLEVIARAAKGTRWVVYPSIEMHRPDMVVRLVGGCARLESRGGANRVVKASELAVRAVVMLRDVIAVRPARGPRPIATAAPSERIRDADPRSPFPPARRVARPRLQRRTLRRVHRLLGAARQRKRRPAASLSVDGARHRARARRFGDRRRRMGRGARRRLVPVRSRLVARSSGLFLARSRAMRDPSTEYSFALIGALSGLGLATTSLALGGGMSEGGALMTHSGGAFGTVLGG